MRLEDKKPSITKMPFQEVVNLVRDIQMDRESGWGRVVVEVEEEEDGGEEGEGD